MQNLHLASNSHAHIRSYIRILGRVLLLDKFSDIFM